MSDVKRFIGEKTAASVSGRLTPTQIYSHYRDWVALEAGGYLEPLSVFGKLFLKHSPYQSRMVHGARVYVGIALI